MGVGGRKEGGRERKRLRVEERKCREREKETRQMLVSHEPLFSLNQ